jgi:hypothetical protein
VTRKPKRNETEGEAEGKTKSNRQTVTIEKLILVLKGKCADLS